MYVYDMYTHVIHMHLSLSIYIYICVHNNICICVYIYIYTHTYTHDECMYACMYVCMCMYACMCVCMYVCMYVCIYIYIYICVYIYIYIFSPTLWTTEQVTSASGTRRTQCMPPMTRTFASALDLLSSFPFDRTWSESSRRTNKQPLTHIICTHTHTHACAMHQGEQLF